MKTYKFFFIVLTAFAFLCKKVNAQTDFVNPQLPSIPDKNFNVKEFNAKGDDITDNTNAIQDAINAAQSAGGGKVIIPAGTYLCGPLQIASNINLNLEEGAILKLLPIDKYPGGIITGTNFITGAKLHDVAITGKGKIDGQGSPWWPYAKDKDAKRPRMIVLRDCDKVLIEDVTLTNSPMFHIAISGKSSNVTVSRVIVRAPASDDPKNPSHNTDACDVSGNNILVKDCDISTGDDNFTCGGGTSNVHIINCKYGYGHGLSIGSYTKGGVSNFLIENCSFNNTESGIRIKSDRDRGGIVENLIYRNIKMNNVGIPILIYAAYNSPQKEYRNLQKITADIASTYSLLPLTNLTPVYKNITFENITATTQKGKRAGLIWGLPEALADNIVFKNVKIDATNAFGIFFAKNISFKNCVIATKEGINWFDTTNASVVVGDKK